MAFSKFRTAIGIVACAVPAAAQAECLGDGCYDGLGVFLLGVAAAAIAVLALAGYVAFRFGKRFGILAALAFLVVIGLFGLFVFSGFL